MSAPTEPRVTLEHCTCGECFDCPDGWHGKEDLPCSCTPDCVLGDETCPKCDLESIENGTCKACGWVLTLTPGERTMTDAEVLDRLAELLAVDLWPGASGMEDLAEIVAKTGRDVTTPRPGVEWESH